MNWTVAILIWIVVLANWFLPWPLTVIVGILLIVAAVPYYANEMLQRRSDRRSTVLP